MTTATAPAPELRIYVTFEPPTRRYSDGWGYGHVYARPMVLGTSKYEPGRALFDPDSYEIEPRPASKYRALKNLRASAQFDDDGPRTYGHEIEYDERGPVTLHRAEEMITWLRKVDKGMRDMSQKFGCPRDFPACLAHFAAVLVPKVPQPFWRDLTAEEANIEGTGYRAMDAESLRWWLEDEMTAYRERAGLPATT